MRTKINKEYLKSLNPCADRWKNYLKHYSQFDGTIAEFLDLKEISFEDKKWVLFRENGLLPEETMREFAMLVACRAVESCESQEIKDYYDLVLHIYTSGETHLLESEEYRAAYRAAYWAAYRAADRVAYSAAYWAAYRAAYRAADRVAEESIQLEILKNLVRP